MSKKNILLLSDPGGGKTVSFETLPGGTIDFNFDPGGWRSLDRPPTPLASKGRHPKKLIHTPTLRDWMKLPTTLAADEILVVDYASSIHPINVGMLTGYSNKTYFDFAQDINILETPQTLGKGICHIAVDSLTQLQWVVLHGMVDLAGHSLKGTSMYTYGLAIEKMREIVDTCCHLPFDFLLTAHVESEKDEVSGKVQDTILLYGKKLPGILLSMIDDIYYASATPSSTGGMEYWFLTSPQMLLRIIRQRSFDNMPTRILPNFKQIYVNGGLYSLPPTVPTGAK